ncbi:MAG TPA: hypothetical protein VGL86_00090, partial [Polyangia bacterium]
MTRIGWIAALALGAVACAYPETRMVPVADYGAGPRQTVSAAPAFTAGPSTTRTTSPDGATRFVCANGATRSGAAVPAGSIPAC